jgi:hypothetical protein
MSTRSGHDCGSYKTVAVGKTVQARCASKGQTSDPIRPAALACAAGLDGDMSRDSIPGTAIAAYQRALPWSDTSDQATHTQSMSVENPLGFLDKTKIVTILIDSEHLWSINMVEAPVNRIRALVHDSITSTQLEQGDNYVQTLQAAFDTMRELMDSFDPAMKFKAAMAMLDFEKTRLRHGRPLAGMDTSTSNTVQSQEPEVDEAAEQQALLEQVADSMSPEEIEYFSSKSEKPKSSVPNRNRTIAVADAGGREYLVGVERILSRVAEGSGPTTPQQPVEPDFRFNAGANSCSTDPKGWC